MTPDHLKNRRLVGVFLFGWLFYNYPVFSLFNLPISVGGVPLIYAYVFWVWALIIGFTMLIMRRDSATIDAGS